MPGLEGVAAAARSLGASPRPSASSEADAAVAATTAKTNNRTLNQELERALEISRLNLQGTFVAHNICSLSKIFS